MSAPQKFDAEGLLKRVEETVALQLTSFKRDLQQSQEDALQSVVKKAKTIERPYEFKKKGNEMNFKQQEEVETTLDDALNNLERNRLAEVKTCLEEGKILVNARKKDIKLADRYGWDFVTEYKRKELADNLGDEKRMKKALKTVTLDRETKRKEKYQRLINRQRYSREPATGVNANSLASATSSSASINSNFPLSRMCFYCGKPGHFWRSCPIKTTTAGYVGSNPMYRQLTAVQPQSATGGVSHSTGQHRGT